MGMLKDRYWSLEAFRDMFEDALEEMVLDRMSSASDRPAMAIAKDVLLAGGKRYRPIMFLLAFKAAGGKDEREVMDFAISAELLHTATLIHDDVYDQSKMRRGKPTIHVTHGISHAIIAGDYLFALGYEMGARFGPEIIDRVGASCARMASSELLQFKHINDLSTKPEDYYAIIDGKTAGPFSTGGACAAIIAGAKKEFVDSLEGSGAEIGRAFQLVDDLLDITGGEKMGKPRGTDVHEGKMTLPIIHGLTMLRGPERLELADVLTNYSDERIEELTELLHKAGSFEYSRLLISNHVARGIEHLDKLPNSDAKSLLIEIAELSRSRTS